MLASELVQVRVFQIYKEGFLLATKDKIHPKSFFGIAKESAAYSLLFEAFLIFKG